MSEKLTALDYNGEFYTNDYEYGTFDLVDGALERLLRFTGSENASLVQLVLLLVVIAVALLLLLAAILSMRSCHLFVSTCWADPDLNLRLLYRQLCCLNPALFMVKKYFEERGLSLSTPKYVELLRRYREKEMRFMHGCRSRFEYKLKLNYLFHKTPIEFTSSARLQALVAAFYRSARSTGARLAEQDELDEVFIVGVKELADQHRVPERTLSVNGARFANLRQTLREQLLVVGSAGDSSASATDADDPSSNAVVTRQPGSVHRTPDWLGDPQPAGLPGANELDRIQRLMFKADRP